ncbi:MAG: hypothetical protein HIU81_13750, partial [Acidobacteria bacterium]|nr:hypothetical protein [Acidobacteriota bacterium]
SGKSMLMLWLTAQWAASGQNQILVDPKTGSDHSATILNASGQVSSLDELSKSDGVFDPIRFSHRKETGIELAVSMLANIDPWGTGRKYEQELMVALNYGMDLGADCTGAALEFARRDGKVSSEIVDPILNLSKVSPLFNACVGRTPGTEGLRVFNGTTLIKVGSVHLDLPDPGNIAGASLIQRINLSLVRMMVFGSAMALEGRGGVIHLDEAWVFLGAGRSEIERLGRVARSQKIQVCLYTQRISDALNAKLDGYISRGIILPIEDQAEARAACQLFKIEPTPERMARITAKATMSSGEGVAPNAASMRALRDPRTKQVIRGTIGIYVDLSGRAVPTEIKLPDNFLADASTNPDDIQSKLEAQARRAA